jgi:hypothetical protein
MGTIIQNYYVGKEDDEEYEESGFGEGFIRDNIGKLILIVIFGVLLYNNWESANAFLKKYNPVSKQVANNVVLEKSKVTDSAKQRKITIAELHKQNLEIERMRK